MDECTFASNGISTPNKREQQRNKLNRATQQQIAIHKTGSDFSNALLNMFLLLAVKVYEKLIFSQISLQKNLVQKLFQIID